MRRVLIVEDDPDLLHLSKYLLQLGGAEGVYASSSTDVRNVDLTAVDAAAVDWMLEGSDGDGVDVVLWLRSQRPDLPVTMFSAAPHGARQRLADVGLPDVQVITKPFTWPDLAHVWGWEDES